MQLKDTTVAERRIFDRFDSPFPAKFKDSAEDYGVNVYLTNASAEGVRLVTKRALHSNDMVELEVKLPEANPKPMAIGGQVVWVRKNEANLWDAGLRFHNISLMHISRLYRKATGGVI